MENINLIKRGSVLVPYDKHDKENLNQLADAVYSTNLKNIDIRTIQQNRAQWLWLNQIANTLNSNNMDIKTIIKPCVEWNKDSVKSIIFDPIMKALYQKESSTKLKRDEYNKIIDTIILTFANRGIKIPDFPNKIT